MNQATNTNQSALPPSIPVTRISAVRGLVPLKLHELWEYRELLFFFIWPDIKGRYKQTALEPLWITLQPIFNMIIFTLIFGVVAKYLLMVFPTQYLTIRPCFRGCVPCTTVFREMFQGGA